ncbi:hypothetical protein ACHAWF_004490 [Thalassiosira exigua]
MRLHRISKRVQNRFCQNITSTTCRIYDTDALNNGFIQCCSHTTSNAFLPALHQLPHRIRWYGSETKIELEEQILPGLESIRPFIRTCLASDERTRKQGLNMEFAVSFLGTGGGTPCAHRISSCTALRLGGQAYIFDACEGVSRQIAFSRIPLTSISKIFISHLHGDHLYGLVPLILSVTVAHRQTQQNPQMIEKHRKEHGEMASLEIYGPPGLYNYVVMTLALSCSKVNYLNIKIIELVGGREERGPKLSQPRMRGRRNIFLSHYPEIETPFLTRQYLEKNRDNIWVIDEPEPISEISAKMGAKFGHTDGHHRLPNDVNLGIGRRLHIKAAELDHIGGVQTFGYTVEEQPPPGTIDADKAKSLGVRPSIKYSLLKSGLSVPTDDGKGEVRADQVIVKSFRPRKFAFLADHRFVTRPMAQLCKDADLLVHEATLSKDDGLIKIRMRGHNTAYNAGVFGKEMGCKVVALNHFGGTVVGGDYVRAIVSEAREGNQNSSQIIATHDFMEVYIPRGGFDFNNAQK